MPRFYFHITGVIEAPDTEGQEFPTTEAAVAAAYQIARELIRDDEETALGGIKLVLVDETGTQVEEIELAQVLRWQH